MNELKVTLKRIVEQEFTRNDALLNDETILLMPKIKVELLSDVKNNLLTVDTHLVYATEKDERGASLRFHFTLEVINLQDLEHVSNPEAGTHEFRFPLNFLETILVDVYATARVLMAQKLADTRYAEIYLPFGGAENLINGMKQKK